MDNDIKAGDKVRFMDAVGEGVVVEVLSGDKIKVEDEDGFDREYHRKELVVVGDRPVRKRLIGISCLLCLIYSLRMWMRRSRNVFVRN